MIKDILNDAGQIVGADGTTIDDGHGFLQQNGDFIKIEPPGAITSEAIDINYNRQIVGLFIDDRGAHGFLAQSEFTTDK